MKKDSMLNQLVLESEKTVSELRSGSNLAPVESIEEWEKLLAAKPPEERQLLEELARFADLWRYLRESGQKLGPEIVDRVRGLNALPVPERIIALQDISQSLMERIGDADSGARLRQ
jgi:hypothetical protein